MRKYFAILILGSFGLAHGQNAPGFQFHFSDEPGPYVVGLKVVEQYDPSRTFQIQSGSPQNRLAGKSARPIQTLVWYPAEKSESPTISLGEYEALLKTEISFGEPSKQGERWAFIESYMRGTTAAHTWAVRDTRMQTGRFPVVIYAPSLNAPAVENIELCEYLASEGFIVVASPSMGAISRSMTVDLAGANAQAQDILFLIDFANSLPNADSSRIAAVGYSWGGMAALFAASRDRRIKALVSLDGSFRYSPETVQGSGDVHPKQMTIPLLVLSRAEEPLETWDAMRKDKSHCDCAPNVLNEWIHGDLIHVHMLAMSHIQFSSLYQRSDRFRNEALHFSPADYSLEEGAASYGWVARFTVEFLKAYLENDSDAFQFLARTPVEDGIPRHLISVSIRHAAQDAKAGDAQK